MEEVICGSCGGRWRSPSNLEPAISREVAILMRAHNTIAAIRRLRETTGLSLRDAKGVLHHVTREPGKCHQCNLPLANNGVSGCKQCRSLNYDW
jgi:hypothetical protein